MSTFKQLSNRVYAGRIFRGVLASAGLLVLLGGNVGAGCSTGGSKVTSIDVPLEYKPRSADGVIVRLPTGTSLKLFVLPTVDSRSDTRTIGQNNEEEAPIPLYGTGKTPADFVSDVLKQEMTSAGLEVTGDVSSTQRQIDTELLKFQVTEGNNYKSVVQLRLKVVDPTGNVLWQGMASGDGSNFGKSKSVVNYQETFSDALREAITKIIGDPKFTEAVAGEK